MRPVEHRNKDRAGTAAPVLSAHYLHVADIGKEQALSQFVQPRAVDWQRRAQLGCGFSLSAPVALVVGVIVPVAGGPPAAHPGAPPAVSAPAAHRPRGFPPPPPVPSHVLPP